MELQQQLIFLFSALGAVNGLGLALYFLFFKGDTRYSDYFLGALLGVISVRIIKSAFLHFNRDLFELFVQIGLSACILIGPLLFLYVWSMTSNGNRVRRYWWCVLLPFIFLIAYLSIRYPFTDSNRAWSPFVESIYKIWLAGIIGSAYLMRDVFTRFFGRSAKITSEERWLLNVFTGVTIVYIAYDTAHYTSYIVGALSFSFVFYLFIILNLYRRQNKVIAVDPPAKYAGSQISPDEEEEIARRLDLLMKEERLYLDATLTLSSLSERMELTRKMLSQVINARKKMNYSRYVSGLRVEHAKALLADVRYRDQKIATIAYDSGFNSVSSFNAQFKKWTGKTPKSYRESCQIPDNVS